MADGEAKLKKNRGHDDKKGGNKGIARAHQRERATRAQERQEARKARSTAEQLTLLDARPGESAKERARLA